MPRKHLVFIGRLKELGSEVSKALQQQWHPQNRLAHPQGAKAGFLQVS